MADIVFIAVVGLFLLLPLEILFLIVIAALKSRPEAIKIVIPEQKRQERYGWEDYLKLPPEKEKGHERNAVLAVLVVIITVILVALPTYVFVVPQLLNQTVNKSATVGSGEPELVETAANLSLNITLPRINFSVPELNISALTAELDISGLREKIGFYKPYIYAVAAAVFLAFASLAVFVYFVNRRKLAVLKKAKETAERLIKKSEKEKPKLQKPALQGLLSRLSAVRRYLAPLIILFLLLIVAFLVYLLRDRISAELSGLIIRLLANVRAFSINYRLYIAAGIAALVVIIIAITRLRKRKGR